MLESDIGINLSGYMHIIFEKGTAIPAEVEVMIKPASSEVELAIYQGPRAYIEENHFIGSTQLLNSNGKFIIKFVLNELLQVYIEKLVCEFPYKKENLGESSSEDLVNRDNEIARQLYIDYIRETLSTLEEVRDKIEDSVIERVKWASGVSDVKDVTKREFELAQLEIEHWLNPILEKLTPSVIPC